MNKFLKIFVAILGATDLIFGIFVPIALSLLLVISIGANPYVLIPIGIGASIYRTIRVWL